MLLAIGRSSPSLHVVGGLLLKYHIKNSMSSGVLLHSFAIYLQNMVEPNTYIIGMFLVQITSNPLRSISDLEIAIFFS